jgi:S1-C subfamily serine protease
VTLSAAVVNAQGQLEAVDDERVLQFGGGEAREQAVMSALAGFGIQGRSEERGRGVIVSDVRPNSDAEQAGFEKGMLINAVNQRRVRNTGDLVEALFPTLLSLDGDEVVDVGVAVGRGGGTLKMRLPQGD